MKMKRIALALLSFIFFAACNNDKPIPDPVDPVINPPVGDGKSISLRILVPANAVTTYAGEAASDNENHIDTIYVDLRQVGGAHDGSDTIINSKKFHRGPDGGMIGVPLANDSVITVGYEVDNIMDGNTLYADVYANRKVPNIITSEITLPIPPTLPTPATSLYMSGRGKLTQDAASGAYKGTIHIIRNVAKLRVNVSPHTIVLPSDLTINYSNIKVQILNVANKTSLWDTDGDGAVTPVYFNYLEHTNPSASAGQIDSAYIYENEQSNSVYTDVDKRTRVKLTLPTSSPTEGSKTAEYTFDLFTNGSYRIFRNYIYTLDIKVRGQSLDPVITLSALPWDDVNVTSPILGTYLTTSTSEISFDANGEAWIDFCTDAQAVYFNFSDFNDNNSCEIGTVTTTDLQPKGIDEVLPGQLPLAPAGFKDGQILLDQQHCGRFGFKLPTSMSSGSVNFSGSICMRAGNIVKCLNFPATRSYDAHYIIGDTLPGSPASEQYKFASVQIDNGDIAHGGWLKLSKNKQWNSSEMLSDYPTGSPLTNLYLHLDENLDGFTRTGSVTVITSNGTEKKIAISQLSAIPIGMYDYQSLFAGDDGNYNRMLYTEQLYEYTAMPIFSPTDAPLLGNNIYNGWSEIWNTVLIAPHPDNTFGDYTYEAINYCRNKNRGSSDGGSYDGSLLWHLPSQAQLMAMYVFYNAYKDHHTANFLYRSSDGAVVEPFYWSSTANATYKISPNKEAQYIDFRYGNTGHRKSDTQMIARCVRSKGDKGISPSAFMDTICPTINFSAPYPLTVDSMPTTRANYYTEDPKTIINSFFGDGTEDGVNNAKVFWKLQVAVRDTSIANVTWATAATLCASYTENGTSTALPAWRLPTQRELMAIWIVQDGLKAKYTTNFEYLSDNYYWSATESSLATGNAWMVFGGRTGAGDAGNTPHYLKTEAAARARCVREVRIP
ncbi:MAG: DUF1566 domain-containing protein [Tannerella sp.]|jgi:hypothetical protein|nr:DUF1566 domain-containing protein [Tannerella sp.]